MDYNQAIEFLYKQLPMFSRVGAAAYKPGLDTSLALDAFFGHPHRKFKAIHVAGTNGKGSVSHMIAAMLQAQGYKTALYTSPHLVDFRERMKIDGEMISEKAVCDFVERFRASGYEGHPSFFELTMMMAFDWFAKQNVDYAVIETGMGGRLDSTNIITPIGCVITNISFDHTQFLGTTLEQIAGEKAGIIKPGIPVTIGETTPQTRPVFEKAAADRNSPITFAQDREITRDMISDRLHGWKGVSALVGDFECGLAGDYQLCNINTVLAAVEMLRNAGVKIDDEAVRTGMRDVRSLTGLRGRWTLLSEKPIVIADTGHNVAGLGYNLHQLNEICSDDKKKRFVIGFVADKDITHILDLFPKDANYYITNAQIPRALPVADLEALCREKGLQVRAFPEVGLAYRAALDDAADDDIVYVGGSTFIVADLLATL